MSVRTDLESGLMLSSHYMTSRKLVHKYNKDLDRTVFSFCHKSPKVVFDIGANMGVYTLFLAQKYKNAHVYAFEPVKLNYDFLVRNIKLNGIQNVTTYNFGFYNIETTMDLGIPKHRENKNTGLYTYTGERKDIQKCQFKKLDDFIEENNIAEVDILKMDVEGAEYKILSVSESFLGKLKYIYVELGVEVADENATLKLLKKHGFQLVKKRRANWLFEKGI